MTDPSPTSSRADRGLRILDLQTAAEIEQEILRIGARREGAELMAPLAQLRLVRLTAVPTAAAGVLKLEMLSAGGDAAIHWQALTGEIDRTDVLLMGTEDAYQQLCGKLAQYDYGLGETAAAVVEAIAHYDAPRGELRCGSHALPLGAKTYLMGILNITPDSFSGDGLGDDPDAVLARATRMVEDGVDILDVGGESTRPGAEAVPLEEELRRVVPIVRALAERFPVPVSVDTYKSAVARAALDAGATIVNDISGLRFDPEMANTVAAAGAALVIMHIKGTPRTMQQNPHYDDLMTEICAYLQDSTAIAAQAGIPAGQVVLDPGFGFGKTPEHNLELLRRLRELTSYGQPVLIGTSRKSTIGRILGDLPPEDRLEGTAATIAIAIAHGADLVRVHDVKPMARVARMTDAIVRAR
ncbi:MAG: dihydropteroate synthase [Armatimonadota bacterium]